MPRELPNRQKADVNDLGSRGTFEQNVVRLALGQLNEVVSKEVYSRLEPDNPGLRSSEVSRRSYMEIADVLAERLERIGKHLQNYDAVGWKGNFIQRCEERHSQLEEQWKAQWVQLCSGKRLIDDIYEEYRVNVSKFDLKRRLVRRMKMEESEDWTLIRSKLRDALEG